MTKSLRKRQAFFLTVFLLFLMIIVPAICLADAEKIFRENNKAVVVVVAYDEAGKAISQGSGFIVRRDGVIVTNYHVISNARSIKIKAGSKVLNVDGIITLDKENDIAILKADAKNMQTVKLGNLEKTNVGEKVYVISSPQGLENTISDGILSGKRELAANKIIIQITAPVSPGSSGGPVFNKNGEVIGVATFLLKESQNLNFAMPVDKIKEQITGNKVTVIKESGIGDYQKTVEYWTKLGDALSQAGKYREAIDAYKQAIQIKPDYSWAHTNLGVAYLTLQQYQEAINSFKQAIRIAPDQAELHNNLGVACRKHGRRREAVDAYNQAVRIKPDYIDVHFALGISYMDLGLYEKSSESFKQAIRIKPDYAAAHFNLGLAYLLLKDSGAALEQYKVLKILDLDLANKLFNFIYP
jgi:Tfp pilus assembly protein PilF